MTTKAPAKKRATSRNLYLGDGFPPTDVSHSYNWELHNKCCTREPVWRPLGWRCVRGAR